MPPMVLTRVGGIAMTGKERDGGVDPWLLGYGYAVLAAMGFGFAFIARKSGMLLYPNAVAGAFWGAMTSLILVLAAAGAQGRVRTLLKQNLRPVPWWFVLAGLASGVALLLQFLTLAHLPAWISSLLHGTQALWVLLWSYLLLGSEERLGRHLLGAVLLVFAGVVIVRLGSP